MKTFFYILTKKVNNISVKYQLSFRSNLLRKQNKCRVHTFSRMLYNKTLLKYFSTLQSKMFV